MKKFLSCVLTIILVCSYFTCFAAYEQYPQFDVSYTVPSGWNFIQKDLLGTVYQYNSNNYEALLMYVIPIGEADYTVEQMQAFCEKRFSDENLSDELTILNDTTINISPNAITTDAVSYGGMNFFKYHKQYTASAHGYYDSIYNINAYLIKPNDNLYMFVHDWDGSAESHSADIEAFLSSLVFKSSDEISIYVNFEPVYPDSAPMIVNDRTMVPIRAVAEKMGFEVSWDATNYIAYVKNPKTGESVSFKINSSVAYKSTGEEILLDSPAFINSDRTYLPLRAVGEAFGAKVEWDGDNREVLITY